MKCSNDGGEEGICVARSRTVSLIRNCPCDGAAAAADDDSALT